MNKLNFIVLFAFSTLLFSCNNNTTLETAISKDVTVHQIDSLKSILNQGISNTENDLIAKRIIKKYTDYAYAFPNDSITKTYLFECAQVNLGIGLAPEAIANLDTFVAWYPKADKAPEALQFKAFILDDRMHRWQKAAEVIDELIAEYPDSDIIDNAKAYKATLGKTPEQIIKEMEAKNNSDNKL
ncbi:MAG: hypothetical protein KAG84_00545 [Bacteroidales bacterium]|nr:hypothetical protein [Bacteroidales bacterium]